jgi:hypothetical protein
VAFLLYKPLISAYNSFIESRKGLNKYVYK